MNVIKRMNEIVERLGEGTSVVIQVGYKFNEKDELVPYDPDKVGLTVRYKGMIYAYEIFAKDLIYATVVDQIVKYIKEDHKQNGIL